MKRKHILILVLAVLMTGLLAGCGNEIDENAETVMQENLYKEETEESEENNAQQDETVGEMPDWLAAYADYIEGMEDDAYNCGFFYADGDDIPEFIIRARKYNIVLTFHDGVVDALQIGRLRLRYIEKKNLFCVTSGQAGEYTNQIYSIENGKWTYVAGGKYVLEFQDGLYVDKFSFEWEGEEVEEELYWENFHQVFDEEQAVVPEEYMRCDTMLSHMETGDFAWVLTAEPYTYTYDVEIIDDFEYSDEYIPISKVDFVSYKNEMSEEDWQALSSFFPILLEGKTFMADFGPSPNEYTDDFKEYNINNLYAIWNDRYPDEFILDRFVLCDLTGNGQKELVVYCNYSIGIYFIFHKEGDDFYAICMHDRWFEDLQKNGIYIGDDGAYTAYFHRLHFLRDVFWGEEIAMFEEGYYEGYYEIGGEEVTEAEMAAWEDEMMVGEVVWYDARADWGINPEDTSNNYLIENIQCIWGTWVITEVWAGQNCLEEDDKIGTIVKILPESFSYGDDTSEEIIGYSTEILAVIGQAESFREIGTYGGLGMTGDYFLIFHPSWDDYKSDIFPFTAFILLSETEMMIPCARSDRILLEKVQDDQIVEADIPLLVCIPHSVCYGEWIITDAIKTDGSLEEESYIGKILQTSEKLKSVTSCRVLGRSMEAVDELADLVGINENNQYVIIYDLSEDHYLWEQMICIDDMTAVLVKGNNLFRIERISDPMEDRIYNEIG